MTREQLAALDPNKVRKDKALFALFKKYITEDNNGVTPQGCLGCSFSKHFSKWRSNYLTQKTPRKMSNSTGRTYELKDANYRVYFKGNVLGSKSTDAEWVDWINHPESEEKRKKRIAQFETLPEELQAKKAAPKKAAAKKTAPKKVEPKQEDNHPESEEKPDSEENPETNE